MAEHTPTLCRLAWQATDVERTQAFLEALFDWTFRPLGEEDAMIFSPRSGAGVSLSRVERVRYGNAFRPQIAVTDLTEFLARARRLSESIVLEEGEIPGVGGYADLRDPDGTIFSVVELVEKKK